MGLSMILGSFKTIAIYVAGLPYGFIYDTWYFMTAAIYVAGLPYGFIYDTL